MCNCDSTLSAIGPNIRAERARRGLRQKDVADRAGVNVSYLSDVEHGRNVPGISILLRIALTLDVPLTALLKEPQRDDPLPAA